MSLTAITDYLASVGCEFPEIGLLQPADPFLDTTGEDLRRRIFITQENSGTTLCLRPEFTVPVCIAHLQGARGPARYAYGGSAFRQRRNEASEFIQAGFEDLGNSDRLQADLNCIEVALRTLDAAGVKETSLIVGNQSIFMKLLDALEIPKAWRKKLIRAFGDTDLLKTHLDVLSGQANPVLEGLPPEIRTALNLGRPAVEEAVKEKMLADGLPLTGGRTSEAIAERILEKAELDAVRLEAEKQTILEAFLQIDVSLADAASTISGFESEFGLVLPQAADALEAYNSTLDRKLDAAVYRASFGRRLDYYTGLVFEVYRNGFDRPLVGGGRYDHLMTLLGSEKEVPAVGFAVWVDRLGEKP
ncbi:MAG: ATP phosphoribosyltransferase regulatory subunit [Pseudomonadota bacterium]